MTNVRHTPVVKVVSVTTPPLKVGTKIPTPLPLVSRPRRNPQGTGDHS